MVVDLSGGEEFGRGSGRNGDWLRLQCLVIPRRSVPHRVDFPAFRTVCAPRVRELLPSSESQRFEKNGRRQIDDPLTGQRIYESVRFRWPRGDVIAFSFIFRQRDHE